MPSLKKLAIRGTLWSVMGYGSGQVLRLGSNLILTRLLFPELFGLMGLVYTFITGLQLFSDIGIRPSIIQNARGDDPDFVNTAWTIQVLRGFGLWLFCFLLAWPAGILYQEPRLYWLLPLVGFSTVLDGLASTSLATLNRQLKIGIITRFELVLQVLSLSVMVGWAVITPDVSALVGSYLVTAAVRMVWSHRLDPQITNRWRWEQSAAVELIKFGRWIFVSTAMTFLASQIDRLMLGKFFPWELLGVYTIAFTWAEIPQQVLNRVSSNVIFPVVSRQLEQPRAQLMAQIRAKRRWILAGFVVGLSGLGVFGDVMMNGLYDARYRDAAWMLPILAIGNWPKLLPTTVDPCLFAIGKPIYIAVGNCLKFIYMLVALPLAYWAYGPPGAVVAIAFNDLPFYLVVNYGLWRERFSVLGQDVLATLALVACLGLLLGVRMALGFGQPLASLMA